MVKLCIEQFVDGRPYPNAARWQATPYTKEWREFSVNWPYSEPLHFLEYLDFKHCLDSLIFFFA